MTEDLTAIRAEAVANDPRGTSSRFAYLSPVEQEIAVRRAATFRTRADWSAQKAGFLDRADLEAYYKAAATGAAGDPPALLEGPSWRARESIARNPPGPLVIGRVPKDEHTILFGPGDVGKGTL